MQTGFIVITEKDWDNATEKQQLWWIFNTLQQVDQRLKKLEGRLWYDKACAIVGGVIGGASAIMAKWFFWR